jgi:drug/metabolite transporter (DMT)-like permease
MMQIKGRLFGLLLFVVFAAMIVYNWHLLIAAHYFYLKMSGVAPLGALGGLLLIFFPQMAGRPDPRDKKKKGVLIILVVVGLVLGGINFYLMDNYHEGVSTGRPAATESQDRPKI